MKKVIYLSILMLLIILCNVNKQSVAEKNITCTGVDIVSIGEKVQILRSNLQGKYEITESIEDSAFSINIGANDFISIVYYNNAIVEIGVFCQKYILDNKIFIGMKIDSLKSVLPNMEVNTNQHDSYEYIEYQCGKNIIEILIEPQKDTDATVGIYDTDSDKTQKFDVNANVTGFIIKSTNL